MLLVVLQPISDFSHVPKDKVRVVKRNKRWQVSQDQRRFHRRRKSSDKSWKEKRSKPAQKIRPTSHEAKRLKSLMWIARGIQLYHLGWTIKRHYQRWRDLIRNAPREGRNITAWWNSEISQKTRWSDTRDPGQGLRNPYEQGEKEQMLASGIHPIHPTGSKYERERDMSRHTLTDCLS